MRTRRIFLLFALSYIFSVAVGIENINSAWGHLLPIPHEEFFADGSGYGKLRGERGKFQDILLIFGTWVYPLCVFGFVECIRQIPKTKSRVKKFTLGACAIFCLAVLARFFYLGVFTVGTGIG
jgi:hypothetical protein